MKKKAIVLLSLIMLKASATDEKKWELTGYLSLMGSVKKEIADTMIFPNGENKHKDAILHNRLNFNWYPTKDITFSIQNRNRIIYDETFEDNPYTRDNFENDAGIVKMSKNWISENNFVMNSSIDRLYLQYTRGNFEISIGRQRINWSQSYAWNPNDIFNASNYFDFDYPEKPGSDALRLQYYTGMASSAEGIIKLDDQKNITVAGLYRFNFKSYDIQFLSGILNQEEFVLGTGWSGNIKNIGFRGEVTSILPYKDTSAYMHSMNDLFMTDFSFDYTFSNSTFIILEILYSNSDVVSLASSFNTLFSSPVTVRSLAFSRLSTLFSVIYPVHPLVNASLSGMYFHKISGYYIGSNIDFSVTNNLTLSLYMQFFDMFLSKEEIIELDDMSIQYLFLRLKYNF